MDDPGLDRARHLRALRALARINTVSLGGARVWTEVRRLSGELQRPVRVLDLACGGGDVLRYVARRADREELSVELVGCDRSPVALEAAAGAMPPAANASFFDADVLHDALPEGFDLVTSSLFLHHLERGDAVSFLRRAAAAGSRLLVQDLRRTRRGYVLAWLGLHALTTSDVARHDGLLSVRAAFTSREARELCGEAGLAGACIQNVWPQRWLLRWKRP